MDSEFTKEEKDCVLRECGIDPIKARKKQSGFRKKSAKISKVSILIAIPLILMWGFFIIYYYSHQVSAYSTKMRIYKEIAYEEFRKNENTNLTGEDLVKQYNYYGLHISGTKAKISDMLKRDKAIPMFWVRVPYYLRLNLKSIYIVIYSKPEFDRVYVIPAKEFKSY